MSSALVGHTLAASDYEEWSQFVSASPDGSVYATAEYLDALCVAAGGRFRIVVVRKGGQIVGGIPLYESPSRGGVRVGPRVLLYYLGPVLRRSDSKYPSQRTAQFVSVLGALADHIGELGFAKVILRLRHTLIDIRPFLARGWTSSASYSYEVPLDNLPGLWSRVEQNLRRLVDRCSEQKMLLTEDDDFDAFLRLHKLTMEHHDAMLYLPDEQFRQWFGTLHRGGLGKVFHARRADGESIASQIVLLGEHPVTHTVCAALDPAHRNLGAAAFLRWRTFEWLSGKGKTVNDLTDASLNSVTHFKSQLGGNLVMNPVIETRGSVGWRAARVLENGYASTRAKASAILKPRGRGAR